MYLVSEKVNFKSFKSLRLYVQMYKIMLKCVTIIYFFQKVKSQGHI